jgi:hypothetical protein
VWSNSGPLVQAAFRDRASAEPAKISEGSQAGAGRGIAVGASLGVLGSSGLATHPRRRRLVGLAGCFSLERGMQAPLAG